MNRRPLCIVLSLFLAPGSCLLRVLPGLFKRTIEGLNNVGRSSKHENQKKQMYK
jgi:hypothetical protein